MASSLPRPAARYRSISDYWSVPRPRPSLSNIYVLDYAGREKRSPKMKRIPLPPPARRDPCLDPPAKLALTARIQEPMPIVELQQVRKVYDTKIAVDDISFTIEPGTMFGLLGPNGSGKTSTIRMMIGITVPDAGTVRLFDKPFDRSALKRVGYLPEERGLYKKMKVMDQLIFLGQLHGLDATI